MLLTDSMATAVYKMPWAFTLKRFKIPFKILPANEVCIKTIRIIYLDC